MTLLRLLSLRHARNHPIRVGLAIMSVALGVAVVVAIETLNQGTLSAFQETMDAMGGRATLRLQGGRSGIEISLIDEVRAIEGVELAAPLLLARTDSPDAGPGQLVVMGVDPSVEELLRNHSSEVMTAGVLERLMSRPNAVLLSEGLARRCKMEVGDVMTARAKEGFLPMHIAGLLAPEGPARMHEDSLVVMPLPFAQLFFGKVGRVDRIDIVTSSYDIDEVAARLEVLIRGRAELIRPAERGREMTGILFGMRAMLSVVSVLALLVGGFLIYNTVSVSLLERRGESALLRAMGAQRRHLRAVMLAEQTLIGCLGGALGTVLGLIGASESRGMLSQVISRAYFEVAIEDVLPTPGRILLGLVAGATAAFLAALLPVIRETAADPVAGMRGDPPQAEGMMRSGPRLLVTLLLGLAVYLLLTQGKGVVPHASITAGLLSIGFVFVAGWPAVRLVSWLAGYLLEPLLGFAARLGRDNLLRDRRRTVLTVLAIAVGASLAFEVQVTLESSQKEILGWIERTVAGDLMVTRVGLLEPAVTNPSMEASARDVVTALPGVADAFPVRLAKLRLEGAETLLLALGKRTDDAVLSFTDGDPAEAIAGFHAGEGVLVSENFRLRTGLGAGDTLELPTLAGQSSVQIAGVIIDYSWPKGLVLFDLAHYRQLFKDDQIDELIIKMSPGAETATVAAAIRASLGEQYPDIYVVTNQAFRDEVDSWIQSFFMLSHAQSLVTLIVAFFGVLNTLVISVLLRRRELAMLRAIGATRRTVATAIAIEGALLGLAGAILGIAFGAWIGYVSVEHASPEEQGWRLPTRIPWSSALALLLACVTTALLASLPPALRATRWNEDALQTLARE